MLLLRGATDCRARISASVDVSIHAPLARSNRRTGRRGHGTRSFNTCSSCEEQLPELKHIALLNRFNTCSSCEEQQARFALCSLPDAFQYMLLLRGATRWRRSGAPTSKRFNTCSSCEEQLVFGKLRTAAQRFQYMLLLRGATRTNKRRKARRSFNTCSSCEEQRGQGKR